MPKLTLTIEYDDGTTKSQSANLDPMPNAEFDKLIDDASLQAGYLSMVKGGDGKLVSNPQTRFSHLSEWLFNVLTKLTKSHRANRDSEAARKAAHDGVSKVRSV